ncbi:BCCT family transporter [Blastococcus sp. KM273128]|uniref:choline BCCT transporter BetT n=1 Tax=Blastococcus sp. KM273128 TaxID=2570314 RepID=UPI001F023B3F|nr:choline BCCT transporter BetT [Blastococcus sp. KM273128]MCF6743857.1 BCCT family transporter [Blastococcus sp. KM273128]
MSDLDVRTAEAGSGLKRRVFYGSVAGVLAIALWATASPSSAAETIGSLVGWTSEWFGWFYIAFATVVLVFVLVIAFSRYGRVKLGPEHSTPQYSTFAWAAMLFAAGIGTDLMFFAVAEPVTQFLAPPVGEGGTPEAAAEATVWTLFHYGINGWGMYALMGMALAYFAYRMNMPLAIRSVLYPIFGKRVHGTLGDAVDVAAVLGTIFGVATSLGIGVVQLNYGLSVLFGIPEGRAAQLGLIALAVGVATISAVSGVDRGIKRLSQLNVVLALGLAGFVLVTGNTAFLLNGLVQNVGDFVSSFPGLTTETFAYDRPDEWLSAWTLFFWAWWIAWASFVGLFLARISRGRTIRQFVAGTLLLPFSYILMWVSIFGNSAIDRIRQGDAAFGETAMNLPERGFYTLLADYPAFPFIASIATFVGLLFYVTSADSGALVMANLSSRLRRPQDDAAPGVRIVWAVATGVLTAAMLLVGGVPALQNATIIMGLPFGFVMLLVMVGLYRALRSEADRAVYRHRVAPSGRPAARRRARLRRRRTPGPTGRERVDQYLHETVRPALAEAAAELRARDVTSDTRWVVDDSGTDCVELTARADDGSPFRYRVRPGRAPHWGGGARPASDPASSQLAVHVDGAASYDVMNFTHAQLIDDVMDRFEQHVDGGVTRS